MEDNRILIKYKPEVKYGKVLPDQLIKLHQEPSLLMMNKNIVRLGYNVKINQLRGYCIDYYQFCDMGFKDGALPESRKVAQVLQLLAGSSLYECLELLKSNLNTQLSFTAERLSLEKAQLYVSDNLPELK